MRRLVSSLLAAAFCSSLLLAADAAKGEWTGYITDTHCGQKGATKEHTADCVEKCMKAGSKAQLFNEADKKLYNLDDFGKVKALVGSRVTVKGSLDQASGLIKVDSVAKTDDAK
jgi:hypothetical protein